MHHHNQLKFYIFLMLLFLQVPYRSCIFRNIFLLYTSNISVTKISVHSVSLEYANFLSDHYSYVVYNKTEYGLWMFTFLLALPIWKAPCYSFSYIILRFCYIWLW
jgi:hypothetical protein